MNKEAFEKGFVEEMEKMGFDKTAGLGSWFKKRWRAMRGPKGWNAWLHHNYATSNAANVFKSSQPPRMPNFGSGPGGPPPKQLGAKLLA